LKQKNENWDRLNTFRWCEISSSIQRDNAIDDDDDDDDERYAQSGKMEREKYIYGSTRTSVKKKSKERKKYFKDIIKNRKKQMSNQINIITRSTSYACSTLFSSHVVKSLWWVFWLVMYLKKYCQDIFFFCLRVDLFFSTRINFPPIKCDLVEKFSIAILL